LQNFACKKAPLSIVNSVAMYEGSHHMNKQENRSYCLLEKMLMAARTDSLIYGLLKEQVTSKWKWSYHLLKLIQACFSAEHKRRYFEECWWPNSWWAPL